MTLDQLVADTVGLLDHLGHDRATVLGHSSGGFLAQLLAAAHPDRLNGLVLANTVPAFDYQPVPPGDDEQLPAEPPRPAQNGSSSTPRARRPS